jgi:hypothetical protein
VHAPDGTPRATKEIAEKVLAWVRERRDFNQALTEHDEAWIDPDDLRRIELCALATQNLALFNELYPYTDQEC